MSWSLAELDEVRSAEALTDDPAWLAACVVADGGRCVVLRRGDVFLPLAWKQRGGLTVVENLGQDYRSVCGPIGSNGHGMPAVETEHLPERADLIDLRRLPRECLPSLFPGGAWRVERFDILHFRRRLEESPDAFLKSLNKSTRGELKYSRNKVEKAFGQANARHEIERLTARDGDRLWEKGASIVPFTWQGKNGVSLLTDQKKKGFLMRLAENGMPVFFHYYYLGEDMAAIAITMEKNGQMLMYAHEYNGDYSKFRPGHLLNYLAISDAMAKRIPELDFGVGDTPHKHAFRCTATELWRLLVPLTWKGRLAVAYQKLRWQAGALINRGKKA